MENCALAHLLYEQRILDFERHGPAVAIDIGGQAFNITDPNPPVTFGDVYTVLTTLTAETKFIDLPPVLMLIVAYLMEKYYLARMLNPFWSYILPKPNVCVFVFISFFSVLDERLFYVRANWHSYSHRYSISFTFILYLTIRGLENRQKKVG